MERIEVHRSSTRGHGIASAAVAARRPSGRGGVSEAHLPAEQPQASQAPRVPSPHVDESRSRGARRPAPQGPAPAVGLSRLHGRSSHAAVRRHGRRVRSGPLSVTVLFASPAQDRARVEVGWAIGRRVGTAVTRNRLRRRLRALLADEHRVTPLPSGAYVVAVDPSAAGLTYAGLSGHVHELAVAVRRAVPS